MIIETSYLNCVEKVIFVNNSIIYYYFANAINFKDLYSNLFISFFFLNCNLINCFRFIGYILYFQKLNHSINAMHQLNRYYYLFYLSILLFHSSEDWSLERKNLLFFQNHQYYINIQLVYLETFFLKCFFN